MDYDGYHNVSTSEHETKRKKRVNPSSFDHPNTCPTFTRGWVKTFVIFFNILIILSAIGLITVGVFMYQKNQTDFISKLTGDIYFIVNFAIVITGVIILATGALGFYALFKDHRGAIYAYSTILLVIFIIEIICGGFALVFDVVLHDHMVNQLSTTMIQEYSDDINNPYTIATNQLQTKLKCCGVQTYRDWSNSPYVKDQVNTTRNKAPTSCCKTQGKKDCSRNTHPSNIYHLGCVPSIVDLYIKGNLMVIGITAMGVAALQLLAVIMSCCLLERTPSMKKSKVTRLSAY